MGVLRSGILGQIRGKVAGVVGGQWKDKNYLREYVKPANPRTVAQQAQRTKFSKAVAFCQPLVGAIFNKYVDPFQKSMSGFNFFIKNNVAKFTLAPDYGSMLLTTGKLYYARVVNPSASAATSTIHAECITSVGNNGSDDDKVYFCAYNQATGRWVFADAEIDRSAGSAGVDMVMPMSNTDGINIYTVVASYDGSRMVMVSNSDHGYIVCTG